MEKLKLNIISPNGELFNGEVVHATFPGAGGSFAVYPMHAPLISSLVAGEIKYFTDENTPQQLKIDSGFVEVKEDTITVCVE